MQAGRNDASIDVEPVRSNGLGLGQKQGIDHPAQVPFSASTHHEVRHVTAYALQGVCDPHAVGLSATEGSQLIHFIAATEGQNVRTADTTGDAFDPRDDRGGRYAHDASNAPDTAALLHILGYPLVHAGLAGLVAIGRTLIPVTSLTPMQLKIPVHAFADTLTWTIPAFDPHGRNIGSR